MEKKNFLPTCLQGNCRDSLGEFSNASYGVLGLRGLIGQVGMQYTKPYKLVHRFLVSASKYCSPANFDCNSGFRVYFLFNSFAKHRSSNLQLLLDCSAQSRYIDGYIDRKFNNQNVTKVTQTKIPSPKFAQSIVTEKQQPYVCIMSVNEGQIYARNKCFLYQDPQIN